MTTQTHMPSSTATEDHSVAPTPTSGVKHRRRASDAAQARDAENNRKLLTVWRKLALFVLVQAAIITILEAWLLTTTGTGSTPNVGPFRTPAPFVEFYQAPNYDGNGIRTNSVGFRYDELDRKKPENELRIFFMSTSLGFNGTTNETTIAGLMEEALAALQTTEKQIRVINASGVSFCSTQSLSLFVTKILDYDPDILIVFHGSEALFMPTEFEGRPGYPFNFALREDRKQDAIARMSALQTVERWLTGTKTMRRFHPDWLQTRLQSRMSDADNRIAITTLAQYEPYIDVLAADIQKIVQISAGLGTKVIVAIPPCRHTAILPGAIEKMEGRLLDQLDDIPAEFVQYVDTIGLDDDIAEARAWGPDGVHWGDLGNRIVANELLKSLTNTKWLEPSAADVADRMPPGRRRRAEVGRSRDDARR